MIPIRMEEATVVAVQSTMSVDILQEKLEI